MTPDRRHLRLGTFGETLAAAHLRRDGMRVLQRNWRCDHGELDIVAIDRGVTVFCEVKTRRSLRFGTPMQAIDDAKAARIRRLAAIWLRQHRQNPPWAKWLGRDGLWDGPADPGGDGWRPENPAIVRPDPSQSHGADDSRPQPGGGSRRDPRQCRRDDSSRSKQVHGSRAIGATTPQPGNGSRAIGVTAPQPGNGSRKAGSAYAGSGSRGGAWPGVGRGFRWVRAVLTVVAWRRGGGWERRFDVVCVLVGGDGAVTIDHRRGVL